jgi:hypothetical protein
MIERRRVLMCERALLSIPIMVGKATWLMFVVLGAYALMID